MPIRHVVSQGECLSTIARKHGYTEWRTIYDHGDNTHLKRNGRSPNVLFPGDIVWIPDKQQKDEDRGTTQRHTFVKPSPMVELNLVLRYTDDHPIASQPYELEVDGERLPDGTTDGDGRVRTQVKATARQGTLRLPNAGLEFALELGELDPHTTITGAQARLNNLGYGCGKVDGIVGPRTRAAALAFQRDHPELRPTGELDAKTCAKLKALHDES